MLWLLPIKRYCQFFGRSGRAEFWRYTAIYAAVVTVAAVIDYEVQGPYGPPVLADLVLVVLALPGYAVLFRRLHDRNLSGWVLGTTILLAGLYSSVDKLRRDIIGTPIEPVYNLLADTALGLSFALLVYIVVQLLLPSDPGANRFGSGPTTTTGPGPGVADLNTRVRRLMQHLARPTEVPEHVAAGRTDAGRAGIPHSHAPGESTAPGGGYTYPDVDGRAS